MRSEFEETFFELEEIFKSMPKELLGKIPYSFIEIIKDNKSNTYHKEINGLENIDDLKKETIVILALIYRDFLCNEEEKEEILKNEKKIIEEKYSYDRIFKNSIQDNKEENTSLVAVKQYKWYMKIIDFFKNKRT